jgi:hypothetical protein
VVPQLINLNAHRLQRIFESLTRCVVPNDNLLGYAVASYNELCGKPADAIEFPRRPLIKILRAPLVGGRRSR